MEIKGIIDDWGCPIIKCMVVNLEETKAQEVLGIIDTGSFHFGLKKNIIERISLTEVNSREINRPVIGNHPSKFFKGKSQIGGGIFSDLLIMVIDDSFNYDFIKGSQFLLGKLFVIDGKNMTWTISF